MSRGAVSHGKMSTFMAVIASTLMADIDLIDQ